MTQDPKNPPQSPPSELTQSDEVRGEPLPSAPPRERPLFLSAQDPSSWAKPEDVSWGDYSLSPLRSLTARHRRLAELLFLGKSGREIAEELGYTEAWVSRLSSNSKVLDEVERLRDKAFEKTVSERLKDLGPQAANVVEEILHDEKEKAALRADLAKWTLEKLTGKAKQEVAVESTTLSTFFELLKQSGERTVLPRVSTPGAPALAGGEPNPSGEPSPVELNPEAPSEPPSKYAAWVDSET